MKKDKEKQIEELLERGTERVIEKDNLKEKLLSEEKLRVKLGIDPTGTKIHLGRATALWKLRKFQDLGHQAVLIIGDFTAQIGDASDKKEMRTGLSKKEIKKNMENYLDQIGKIIDLDKAEVHYNSEWLGKLSAGKLLSIAKKFTAQQMIQRRNFKERWEKSKPIGLHEINYPLLQGYDSVQIKADLELGGYDQLFNLKIGRELQKIFNQEPQDMMTMEMLYGLDGRKMSTSWGNVINIIDDPKEMYGKIMSMKDELIYDYFRLCTDVDLKEIEEIKEKIEGGNFNPKKAKEKLGREIVERYYNKKKAKKTAKEFNRVFKDKELPEDIKEFNPFKEIEEEIKDGKLDIITLTCASGMASSNNEVKRLVEQGGVKIDGEKIEKWNKEINLDKEFVLQVGKKKFRKIVPEK